ncbi:hypothetical protein SANTM175S_04890 [Streptomyces antimycoticus]
MSLICTQWLTTATRPVVARNAVIASTTGSSAATSAPKTISRMPRATGSAENSAWVKSSPNASSNAFWPLASPNSSIRRSWWRSWALPTASRTGWMCSDAFSGSPRISNCTSAERRSAEMVLVSYGDRRAVTWPVSRTPAITASTALWKAGSFAVSPALFAWIRTVSPAAASMPASSRIVETRPDSPGTCSLSDTSTRPVIEPTARARMTSSTQPPTAAHR